MNLFLSYCYYYCCYFFQLEGRVNDKNNVRFTPQTRNSNQQKICESFVVYPNHKSVPTQDMVYTSMATPYTEIESIV